MSSVFIKNIWLLVFRVYKLNDNTRHDKLLCKMHATTETGFLIVQCMKDVPVNMVVDAINSYLQYSVIY